MTNKSPNIPGHASALTENTSELILERNKYIVLKLFILEHFTIKFTK